jgi:hypothetical protein
LDGEQCGLDEMDFGFPAFLAFEKLEKIPIAMCTEGRFAFFNCAPENRLRRQ